MPYVKCPRCGLLTFSAARWSPIDRCGGCDEELPRPRRTTPGELRRSTPNPGLDVEDAVRERLYGGPRTGVVDSTRRG